MKTILLSALIWWPGMGQTATLTLSCPNNVRAGAALTCSIALSGGALPAGLQFTLAGSSLTGPVVTTVGAAAVDAGKSIACNVANTCLLTGINGNQIADGAVAALRIQISGATAGQQMNLNLSAAIAASLAGTGVPTAVNPPVSVSVLSACDIDGDGQTDDSDVTALQNEVLAIPQGASDLNGDGRVDAVDVQIVINAARGVGCSAQ